MNSTKIEWCDKTLNPVVGCTFGCPFCYARVMNNRFHYTADFSEPEFFPERLKQLYSNKPQRIFMDSMSDIADWLPGWQSAVFKAIGDNPQHKYLFLTKRPQFLDAQQYEQALPIGDNLWYGTSITGSPHVEPFISRMRYNAFISFEPLLTQISEWGFALSAIQSNMVKWVIIGAETGIHKNKVIPKKEWIDEIIACCKQSHVPVFMKNSLMDIMGESGMLYEFPSGLQLH